MSFYADTNNKDFSSMKMWLQKFLDLKISPSFLSKESVENMLNAMKSAGIISDYTMAYSNGQYTFTFVKAQEANTNQVNNESNI